MAWWEELDGPLLGRYRIERVLGEGGMARVFLARDLQMDRLVAIKTPKIESFPPDRLTELLARFTREFRSQADEPIHGVIPFYEAGEFPDQRGVRRPYLVMQYLPGGSLGDRLGGRPGQRPNRQTLAEVIDWLRPIATTLDRLHARRYLHRDVKPDNILFNTDGDAFLADFGIATTLDPGTGTLLSEIGTVGPGSPGYQAPETLRGEKLAASDQFSLAVTAYDALSGRMPTQAGTRDGWIAALANWQPTPLQQYNPELPAGAASAIMRAMSAQPGDRFTSCAEFVGRLSEAAAGRGAAAAVTEAATTTLPPVAARPPAPAPAAKQPRKVWLWVFGLVAMLIAGLVGTYFVLEHQADQDLIAAHMAQPAETKQSQEVSSFLTASLAGLAKLEFDLRSAQAVAKADTHNAALAGAGEAQRRAALSSSLKLMGVARELSEQAAIVFKPAQQWFQLGREEGQEALKFATTRARLAFDAVNAAEHVKDGVVKASSAELEQQVVEVGAMADKTAREIDEQYRNNLDVERKFGYFVAQVERDIHDRIFAGEPFEFRSRHTRLLENATGRAATTDCDRLITIAKDPKRPTIYLIETQLHCPAIGETIQHRAELTPAYAATRNSVHGSLAQLASSCKLAAGTPCVGFKTPRVDDRAGATISLVTPDVLIIETDTTLQGVQKLEYDVLLRRCWEQGCAGAE